MATKAEAKARKEAWQQALLDGRVLRINGGLTLRSFPTVEAAQSFVAECAEQGYPAEIVVVS